MKEKNFTVIKLRDSSYGNVIPNVDSEVIYCEIQYQRDRSSFAGIALKVTGEKKKNCSKRMSRKNCAKYWHI